MKILLTTLDWPQAFGGSGGIGNYYYQLVVLAPHNINVEVLTPINNPGVIQAPFYHPRLWPHWQPLFEKLKTYVIGKNYDYYWAGQIWPIGLVCFFLSLYFPKKCRYIISLHGLDIQIVKKNPFKKFIAKQILKRAQFITVNSEFTKKLTQEICPNQNYFIIYPAANKLPVPSQVEVKELINAYGLADKKILLSVSRLVKRKGQDLIIKTLNELWLTLPDLFFVCIGNGPESVALQKLAQTTTRPNQIIFIKEASNQALAAWYAAAHIFALPVHQDNNDPEGFGMVYLEANAFGLPAIGSRSGGIPEAISDQHSGLLIPPDDQKAFMAAVTKLFSDQSFLTKIRQNAPEWAQKFTWSNSAKKLYNAMEKL